MKTDEITNQLFHPFLVLIGSLSLSVTDLPWNLKTARASQRVNGPPRKMKSQMFLNIDVALFYRE